MPPLLTIIMPVYNEEGSIESAVEELREQVLGSIAGAELLAVDDGSKDRSSAMLDALAAKYPEVRVLHKPNGGHGDALRYGLDRAEGEYLFLIDSDRQIPVEDFTLLWDRRKAAKLVSGIRVTRHDPLHRLILTRIVRLGIWLLFHKWIRDANIPFKLLHRAAWERLSPLIAPGVLTPSLFLAIAAAVDPEVEFEAVAVEHRPRTTGVTVLRPWKLTRFCWQAFREMIEFRRRLRAHLRKLRRKEGRR